MFKLLLPKNIYSKIGAWGRFKNTCELLNPRALKISKLYTNRMFQCMRRYFVWNFKGSLWNSAQNILSIHWNMCILFTGEILRAFRFKSSSAFLKRPLIMFWCVLSWFHYQFMWIGRLQLRKWKDKKLGYFMAFIVVFQTHSMPIGKGLGFLQGCENFKDPIFNQKPWTSMLFVTYYGMKGWNRFAVFL